MNPLPPLSPPPPILLCQNVTPPQAAEDSPPHSTTDDSDDSDDSAFTPGDEYSDSDDDEGLELDEEEITESKFFQNIDGTHVCDETIFTMENLEALKLREIAMVQRNERGYYRCKVTHTKLYNEITHEMKRFLLVKCWNS